VLLQGRGICLAIAGKPILTGVDVAVKQRQIVTLIGPNGAGKTTLIRALLGLITIDAGAVGRRTELRLGYLPQRFAIDPVLPLSVARLMTLTRRSPRQAVAGALAETGVAHLIDAPVQTLSGGELQRVLLARALSVDPDLLVLDEPVQGVDYAGEAALYTLISHIRDRRGCGILMVSHDLHVVMAATDTVVCLNRHVCCSGTPESVGLHPEYRRLFGRRAAEAVAIYRHQHDHGHALSGEVVGAGETPLVDGHPRGCGRP
jgi:zinc transport system ATP-binding protein